MRRAGRAAGPQGSAKRAGSRFHGTLLTFKRFAPITLSLTLLFLSDCAKFPSETITSVKRLTFSMTVDGQINSNYIYIFALRPLNQLNPIDQGPLPVIAPPWGNGFVAGNCTYFVRWDPTTSPAYTLYQFRDSTLQQWFPIGVPVIYTDVPTTGGKTLTFELDLSQIAPTADAASQYQSIQINLLTMNTAPQGTTGSKVWDAIGNGNDPSQVNTYLTIPLNVNGTYNNLRYNGIEPKGDSPDPDLDITDFSVEVRSP